MDEPIITPHDEAIDQDIDQFCENVEVIGRLGGEHLLIFVHWLIDVAALAGGITLPYHLEEGLVPPVPPEALAVWRRSRGASPEVHEQVLDELRAIYEAGVANLVADGVSEEAGR